MGNTAESPCCAAAPRPYIGGHEALGPTDPAEKAIIDFFAGREPGWTVERPAPSIERVSCYVLDGGSVIVTEYQGCSFSVFTPAGGELGLDHGAMLEELQALVGVDAACAQRLPSRGP